MRAVFFTVSMLFGVTLAGISTDKTCSTQYGKTPVKTVPTSSKTFKVSSTAHQNYCAPITKTITPRPVTTTLTYTVTSLVVTVPQQSTATAYSTVTATTQSTVTAVASSTVTAVTVTTNVTTPSTTVPTPSGFTAVGAAASVSVTASSRNYQDNFVALEGRIAPTPYPTAVDCTFVIHNTITKTSTVNNCVGAPTFYFTLPTRTSIFKQTITTTVTSTSTPANASTTATITSLFVNTVTTTSTSVTTSYSTTTESSTAPVATFYAACSSDNIVESANGNNGIDALDFGDASISSIDASSSLDCCVACQKADNCGFSTFGYGTCYLGITNGTCDGSNSHNALFKTSPSAGKGYAISNGACGQIANGGED